MSDFKNLIGKVNKLANNTSPNYYKKNGTKEVVKPRFNDFVSSAVSLNGFEIGSEDILEYKNHGVQDSVLKKLSKGEVIPHESIDLHGMTLSEADIYVSDFIDSINMPYMSCIRIIHGKGYSSESTSLPKLKNFISRYLSDHHRVLAYSSCPVSHGGAGALYVLISKI